MIDVILPVYNASAFIGASIDSVLAQTYRNFRLIIVDDGSTDGTAAVLADYAARDDRITVIRKENSGIVDTLNLGIRESRAPIIARQDADDISLPHRFETQLGYLTQNDDTLAVGCATFTLTPEGKLAEFTAWRSDASRCDPDACPAAEPYIPHPFLMMRRSAFEAVGGYRHVIHAEDADLYWRLVLLGRLHNLRHVLGAYRIHDQSVSGVSLKNGRVQTIYSQLAAMSFRRRRAGGTDLEFDRGRLVQLMKVETHEAMCAVFDDMLDDEERDFLRTASAMKLLEAATIRPYSVLAGDIARVIDLYPTLHGKDPGTARYARHLAKRILKHPRTILSRAERKWLRKKSFRTFQLYPLRRKFGAA